MKLLNCRCNLSYLTRDACIWSEEIFSPMDYIDVLCCPAELPTLPSRMWIHGIIEWFVQEGTLKGHLISPLAVSRDTLH